MGVKSIMIVGVGGQGTLLASKLLGNALLSRGFDVKVSEVHGMSVGAKMRRSTPLLLKRVRPMSSSLLSSWKQRGGFPI